ncbi:MAG: hypothetical protein NVS9B13_15230 [Candidatus Acidiferrum sp.]
MLQSKNSSESEFSEQAPADHPDPALVSKNEREDKGMFIVQNWHKAYGQALLEANSSKQPEMIAAAEGAILNRRVELPYSDVPEGERLDLNDALGVLSHLKKTNVSD